MILSTWSDFVTGMTSGFVKNRQVPRIFLATFNLMPDGEPCGDLVTDALARRGLDADWVVWDDDSVAWGDADLVAVRSTWDYHRRLPEFLGWARHVEARTRLLNGADVFTWNADKAYLAGLADDLPCVPTALLDDRSLVGGLQEATERWGTVVIKPRVGASGIGVVVVTGVEDERLQMLAPAPWVVQPLVESVRIMGETSVYVFGGRAVSQVDKRAAGDEIRVHEAYGGRSVAAALDPERAALAEEAVTVVGARFGRAPAYARVDVMRWQDAWVVSELELIEPGLYLDVDPANADRFADLVVSVL